MSELDRMIEATLNEEDKAFFAKAGREPGYFGEVVGLFGGTLGWMNALVLAATTALFIGGVWCAWQFFQAEEAISALRWGLSAAVLLISVVVLKVGTIWPTFQANRVLREIKRVELQIARRAAK
ncbi:MAG TPA: DUF6768 family protein [Hyphomonadaceae bacterium]|nr:DUF6768 family protein [Hyphomonadaceae bacterium]